MHDRIKPIPRPNAQAGFITVLVLPLWKQLNEPAFARIMNCRPILTGLEANLGRYVDMIAKAKAAAAAAAAGVAEASKAAPAASSNPPPPPSSSSSVPPPT